MATLHIYVRSRNGRTESLFAVPAGSKVVFHNADCDEPLSVLVHRVVARKPPGPRKRGRVIRRKPRLIRVGANKERAFRIPRSARAETEYKYSAWIGRARVEDPIIYVPGKTKR